MAEPETVVYDFLKDAAAYFNALESDHTLEITQGTFDYFLNVLPPVYMGRSIVLDGHSRHVAFGFAEGCERITAFWVERRDNLVHYLCKRTREMNRP